MRKYSIEPRTRNYIKGYRFSLFARNLFNDHGKKLLDAANETKLDATNTVSKKVLHKTAESSWKLIGKSRWKYCATETCDWC